ncbi:terpene synthase 10 isoform X2 [Ziziphus jujuba]|uniref:Terpene synthase 10 isoform X2 n=1 Tax=Ziziphus jujuba TaxID=326968 RepID=A0ABM3ICB8_ZIZJJ|nr:terpene synthase 10 isoform X2 [Ziziphus jujuba]
MAYPLLASVPICNFTRLRTSMPPISLPKSTTTRLVVRAKQISTTSTSANTSTTIYKSDPDIARRSGDYKPAIWNFDHIQSLSSDYAGEPYARLVDMLKEEVRVMLQEADCLAQLELIDMLQKLGVSYHFEDQIQSILKDMFNNIMYTNKNKDMMNNNLYATALQLRLLRQHGYWLPQEVFNGFKDKTGNFKASLGEDTEGMLALYQASYYLIQGEDILEEAKDFATKHLQEYMQRPNKDQTLSQLISHALELPLHWRVPRFETRWFIQVYEKKQGMNPFLIELAKLDFNILQSIYQEDMKYAFRWWKNSKLVENLSYARDRMMVSFLWTVGVTFEPELGYCRKLSAIVNAMITVIDDTYDVYGTLEELELFTDAVQRWDVNAIDHLPDYMKLCFLALHHSVNEIAFDVFKEQGIYILKFLKNTWIGLCKAYLQEAKWYYSGYKPSLEEYIENACMSIATPVILVHAFATATNPITEEAMKSMDEYPEYEMQRGDVPKSIQCYMNETGASEGEAREHIKLMISETWKKMNRYKKESGGFSKIFIERAMHLGRTAQYMYLYGDGHGIEEKETKDRVLSLFFNPIPLN